MAKSVRQAIIVQQETIDSNRLTEDTALFNPDGTPYPAVVPEELPSLGPVFSNNATTFDGIDFISQNDVLVPPSEGGTGFQHWDALSLVETIKFTRFSIQIQWVDSPGGDPGEIVLNWPAMVEQAYGEGSSIFGDEFYVFRGTIGGEEEFGFVRLDAPLLTFGGTNLPAIQAGDSIIFSGQAMINVPAPIPGD